MKCVHDILEYAHKGLINPLRKAIPSASPDQLRVCLVLAKMNGHQKCVELLIKEGAEEYQYPHTSVFIDVEVDKEGEDAGM